MTKIVILLSNLKSKCLRLLGNFPAIGRRGFRHFVIRTCPKSSCICAETPINLLASDTVQRYTVSLHSLTSVTMSHRSIPAGAPMAPGVSWRAP